MNKQAVTYFILGISVILISTPLGYSLVKIVYRNKSLAEEYVPILNGFIYSLMLVGILVFSIGVITFIKNKD
ncbi:glycosyl transferase [Psychrobacillus sp. FSL W7-1457]|uniref:glycosyl transferase n=1 Tax=unclassified Psychrobacillus TaxID=2636677 RepID=UPI00203D15A8|nr:glycosyl transferase [Psychrobacillus sp. MER TA 171]